MSTPSVKEPSDWLSAIPPERAYSSSNESLAVDADAPDFGSIPRDKTGARAAAVLALYESDLTNKPANQCLNWIATEIGLNRKLRLFAMSLASEAEKDRTFLDRSLNRFSHRWTMNEASPVVRNILRTALVEFDLFPKTNVAVVISEAVKLSQMFDTRITGSFVNGVLGALVRSAENDDSPA